MSSHDVGHPPHLDPRALNYASFYDVGPRIRVLSHTASCDVAHLRPTMYASYISHWVQLVLKVLVAGGSVALMRSRIGLFTVCAARSEKLNWLRSCLLSSGGQGLTLVDFSAQHKPFLKQNTP